MFGRYWDEANDLFHSRLPADSDDKRFDYWWQAQALDVLVDAYERSGDRIWLERGRRLFGGVVKRNGGLTNDYYDDMLWFALALQRLHRHDPDDRIAAAIRHLWRDIRRGRNGHHGGGIAWRKQQADYKSVPSNAPAVILGARLFREAGRQENLDLAIGVFEWLEKTLVDPDSGLIWDGINRRGDGRIDRNWLFTYNQGTFIGAAMELHRATGERDYLEKAARTAKAAMSRLVDENGILREGGLGDGGLFKGIFVRYLGAFARMDRAKGGAYAEFLVRQAEALWKLADPPERPVFPAAWRGGPARGRNELGSQLSAVALLEQVAAWNKDDGA